MSRNKFTLIVLATAAMAPFGLVGFLSPNRAAVSTFAASSGTHQSRYGTLMCAISQRDPAAVSAALSQGCDPNYMPPTPGYRTSRPLCVAAMIGDTQVVHLLLQRGASVEVGDGLNGTPLDAAAVMNRPEVVKQFLAAGAEVNDTRHGSTALWTATECSAVETAAVLLANGANPNTALEPQEQDYRVIDLAAERHNTRIVALLEHHGAKPPIGHHPPAQDGNHAWVWERGDDGMR